MDLSVSVWPCSALRIRPAMTGTCLCVSWDTMERNIVRNCPGKNDIRHTDEILKLMAALTRDDRFLDSLDSKGERPTTMREAIIDNAEKRGMEKGRLETLTQLLREGIITLEQAAAAAGMTPEEFCRKAGLR